MNFLHVALDLRVKPIEWYQIVKVEILSLNIRNGTEMNVNGFFINFKEQMQTRFITLPRSCSINVDNFTVNSFQGYWTVDSDSSTITPTTTTSIMTAFVAIDSATTSKNFLHSPCPSSKCGE
jgi:hypothetical protein